MVMRDMKDYRADYEGASRINDLVTVFLACLLLILGMGAAWSVGSELQQCRLDDEREPVVDAFGTQR